MYNVKKLSYCWDSSRYDKITDSGRSANTNRNHQYDLCKFYFTNRAVNTWSSVGLASYVVWANTLKHFKSRLDNQLYCAQTAQTSAKASKLNRKWSGIRIRISPLIRIRSQKCRGFITLLASIIIIIIIIIICIFIERHICLQKATEAPSVVKICWWLYEKSEMLINLQKSHILQWWGKWKSDPEFVFGTGSLPDF